MGLLIQGGRVIDPASGVDGVMDLWVEDGRIAAMGRDLGEQLGSRNGRSGLKRSRLEGSSLDPSELERAGVERPELRVVDASGLVLTPGLIDMHVHLREPGQEHKETLGTGGRAAAAGGFTSVACMPNTEPVADSAAVIELIRARAARESPVNVFPVGAITRGLEGRRLAEYDELKAAGAVALSDDGRTVMDAAVLRRAMLYASALDLPILEHCQDENLAAGGAMNEGPTATALGLRGIPAVAEEVIVARDLLLAEETGARLHIQHVSTAGSVRLIREAKQRGVRVTAEVTPHHLILTEEAVGLFDTRAKVNPPLRTSRDVQALVEGLADGTIDCIATDHAPHAPEEKELEFERAPFGMIGLETCVPLVLSRLVATGRVELGRVLEALTAAPARVLGIDSLGRGTLRVGGPADITILDLHAPFTVRAAEGQSRASNTPFDGWQLAGRAVMTVVAGRVVWNLLEAHRTGASPVSGAPPVAGAVAHAAGPGAGSGLEVDVR